MLLNGVVFVVVKIPNGLGCALGTVQLILYFIYCGNKGEKSTDDAEKDEKNTVEMKDEEKKQNVVNGKKQEQPV